MPPTPRPPSPEPLRAKLSDADNRIRLDHWMPPKNGIFPRIRIGRKWINTLCGNAGQDAFREGASASIGSFVVMSPIDHRKRGVVTPKTSLEIGRQET
jgi:hypothetical protein